MEMALRGFEVLVGVYYFIFGIDGFLKKIPLPQPSERALRFLIAIDDTKYILFVVKICEILVGIAWITGVGSGLAWIILTPIWLNILAYHFCLNKKEVLLPLWLLASHLTLAYKNGSFLWSVISSSFSN